MKFYIYGKIGLLVFVIIFGFNIWLNSNVVVVEEEVFISDLPIEFEGFRILQLSDLHGGWFGDSQEGLLGVVNGIECDLVVMTGDMGDRDFGESWDSVMALVEGLKDKGTEVAYIEGNHGPFVVDEVSGGLTYEGDWLSEQGVRLLRIEPILVERSGKLLVVEEFSLRDESVRLDGVGDVRVGLSHYPMNEAFYEGRDLDYDLVLAGHFHGGQWRVPGFGAVFIPDIFGAGWFPDQDYVSGLVEYGGVQQYVSRGLGASGK
ncbi:MAG TPA: hypothetical protein DCY20_11895, partial [Firmicutes bacterium]|nr:hypothetical protein [Bacillota bacterium]